MNHKKVWVLLLSITFLGFTGRVMALPRIVVPGTGIFVESGQTIGTIDSAGGAIADVNNDGDFDIIIAGWETLDGSDGVEDQIWFNDGNSNFTDSGQRLGGTIRTSSIAVGDFNGDGFVDLILGQWEENSPEQIWLNDGTGHFFHHQDLPGNNNTMVIQVGDLNGDNDLDIFEGVWGIPSRVWHNDGNGNFTAGQQTIGDVQVLGAALGDVDGDEDLDIFLSRYSGLPDLVWFNNGSGIFIDSGQQLGIRSGDDISLGDLDNDGDLDALGANRIQGSFPVGNQVLVNNGAGFFTEGQIFGNLDSRGVALGDLDNDGDLDAFFANQDGQPDEVWFNNGDATFTNSGQALGSESGRWVGLADFDGNGTQDAFVANQGDDRVYWNQESHLLAIELLAFDNHSLSPVDLSPYEDPTISALIESSRNQSNLTVVVLIDSNGAADTRVYVIQEGMINLIQGLPDTNGNLSSSIGEYDMTDGATLGGFLLWARNTYPADRTSISFVGHGTGITPDVDVEDIFMSPTLEKAILNFLNFIFPTPSRIGADPTFTDIHPTVGLITPYALRTALDVATVGGDNPIDILDLVHCFAATVEEFYELSDPAYATILIGSPNYAYFSPAMLANALPGLANNATPAGMATALVNVYETTLQNADTVDGDPDIDHPRRIVAFRADRLATVKGEIDEVAWNWQQEMAINPVNAVNKLAAAYQAAEAYYDSTFCKPQDWELAAPDALVDVKLFMQRLAQEFGPSSGVGIQALQVVSTVESAIVVQTGQSGVPWYAAPATPYWPLGNPDLSGLGLYADFQGRTEEDVRYLTWQARFYTPQTSIGASDDNPHPLQFVLGGYNGITWSNVLQDFWAWRVENEGIELQTEACLPDLQPVSSESELAALYFVFPLERMVRVDYPTRPTLAIQASGVTLNALVTFQIWDLHENIVFTDTVSTGYLLPGTHAVTASEIWRPTEPGWYIIEAVVDSDNRVIEANEADNTLMKGYTALRGEPITFTAELNSQWHTNLTIPVTVTELSPPTIDSIVVQIYEYVPDVHPDLQVPQLTREWEIESPSLPYLSIELPTTVKPGAIIMHLWAVKGDGLSQEPVILPFNYAPLSSTLQPYESHYYIFHALEGGSFQANLEVLSGIATFRVWEPLNPWQAHERQGSNSIMLSPTYEGAYLIMVENDSTEDIAQYNVNITPEEQQLLLSSGKFLGEPVQLYRPYFLHPIADAPYDYLVYSVFLPIIVNQ